MTPKCLSMQARNPGSREGLLICHYHLYNQSWAFCTADWMSRAKSYRGVRGQRQDVGRSGFDLVQHGGCRDPAGSAPLLSVLLFTLPPPAAICVASGWHLGYCRRWAMGKYFPHGREDQRRRSSGAGKKTSYPTAQSPGTRVELAPFPDGELV